MATNDYHFITHWRVPGTVKEVSEIIGDAAELPRWWPSVYLDVKILKPGDASGIGREVALYTKGWLPYTLRWDFTVTEVAPGKRIVLVARGDFVGRGIWTFEPDGDHVNITYDWNIRAEKPLLRSLSLLLKPIFSANHRWAMRQGEKSLLLELARRRASSDEERARLPAPPGPVRFPTPAQLALSLALLGALWLILAWARRT